MVFWIDVLRGIGELVAPTQCAACDLELRQEERGFCSGCGVLLEATHRTLQPPAHSAALYVYGGPLATALRRLKYGGRPDLAGPLGGLVAATACAYGGKVDCVVPVPLHSARLRERGYNQSMLLARPLARALGVPFGHGLLTRCRPTSAQAQLPRERRAGNVQGAFRAGTRARAGRVLLVDDVRTSGCTLAAAAQALTDAGATDVYTLALAFAQS